MKSVSHFVNIEQKMGIGIISVVEIKFIITNLAYLLQVRSCIGSCLSATHTETATESHYFLHLNNIFYGSVILN